MSAEVDREYKWACPYPETHDVIICMVCLWCCGYITETSIKTT